MALWMNRAGGAGEWEQAFLQDSRIYLQWQELNQDLSKIQEKSDLRELLQQTYPTAPQGRISSYLGQIWIFVKHDEAGRLGWLAKQIQTRDSLRGDYWELPVRSEI